MEKRKCMLCHKAPPNPYMHNFCVGCEQIVRNANAFRQVSSGIVHAAHMNFHSEISENWRGVTGWAKCGREIGIDTYKPVHLDVTCKDCLRDLGKLGRVTVNYDPENEVVLVVPKLCVFTDNTTVPDVKVKIAPGQLDEYMRS